MVVAAFTWGIGFARGDLADLPVVGGGGGGGNGDGGNSSRRGMSGSLEGLIGMPRITTLARSVTDCFSGQALT